MENNKTVARPGDKEPSNKPSFMRPPSEVSIRSTSTGLRLGALTAPLLITYVVVYLFIPYKPLGLPASFHTLALILGIIALLWESGGTPWRETQWLPGELALILAMVGLFIFSSAIVHYEVFSLPGFQAYCFSFLAFLFVRCAVNKLNLNILYAFLAVYMIATGILMFLQVCFGPAFYVSNFLSQKGFENMGPILGNGFSDYSSAASGLVLWPLSILVTRYSLMPKDNRGGLATLFRAAVIGFGALALFYNLSRGAWLGMFCVLALILFALLIARRDLTGLAQSAAIIVGVFVMAAILPRTIYHSEIINQKIDLNFRWFLMSPEGKVAERKLAEGKVAEQELTEVKAAGRKLSEGKVVEQELAERRVAERKLSKEKVVAQKLAEEKGPDSANTRLHLYRVAALNIQEHPFWGIGVDRFQGAYKAYYDALPAAERAGMDTNLKVNAHNFVLSYMVDVGIVSFVPFAGLLMLTMVFALRAGIDSDAFPFLMGLAALCVWLMVTDGFTERLLWVALAMTSGLVSSHNLRADNGNDAEKAL